MSKKTTKKRAFTVDEINKFKEIVGKINQLEPKAKSEPVGSILISVMREKLNDFEMALKNKGYTVKDLVKYINEQGFPISEFVFKKYLQIVRDERDGVIRQPKAKASAKDVSLPEQSDSNKTDAAPESVKPVKNIDKADGNKKTKFNDDVDV